jgi:DNA invertase Pin-like site-specific DNA recombinase
MPRRKRSLASRRAPLAPGALVFGYLRDSGGAAQEKSVADQRQALLAYAGQHGWLVAGWYVDEARPGSDAARRPAFQEMIAACRAEPVPVAAVLVWSLSRLGRDELDAQFYRADLRRRAVEVVSVNPAESVPNGPAGFLFEALIDWKNRSFLDDMSRDVRRGLRANVLLGYAPGGTPPVGYKAAPVAIGVKRDGQPRLVARWLIDPVSAPRVRQAFAMFAAGYSYAEIHAATALHRSRVSYSSMVRNRTYLGRLKFGAEEFAGLEPLVDEELWARCQARISERARGRSGPPLDFLLSGLAVCGYCGAAMAGGHDRRNEKRGYQAWRYYACGAHRRFGHEHCPSSAHVAADRLEPRVVALVLREILTPDNVAKLLGEIQQRLSGADTEQQIANLDERITGARRAISHLLDVIETGELSSEIVVRLRGREAEYAGLEEERLRLVRMQTAMRAEFTASDLVVVLEALRAQVTAEETPAARRALKAFIERVEVRGKEFRVVYRPEALHAQIGMPPRGHGGCACSALASVASAAYESGGG